jgi:hypothetical protein
VHELAQVVARLPGVPTLAAMASTNWRFAARKASPSGVMLCSFVPSG